MKTKTDRLRKSSKKTRRKLFNLRTIKFLLFFVIIVVFGIAIFGNTISNLFKTKLLLECPVKSEYCKNPEQYKAFNRQENTTFSSLSFILTEGVQVLTAKDNLVHVVHPANDSRVLKSQTYVDAKFENKSKNYIIGYIFEGIPVVESGKTLQAGEPIGTIQSKKGRNLKENEGSLYTLMMFVKDLQNNRYLDLTVSSDGRKIIAQ